MQYVKGIKCARVGVPRFSGESAEVAFVEIEDCTYELVEWNVTAQI